ncbi:hypothetical protein BDZ94DRAFT_1266509 [Collybia nuda]|uniref:Uncharacterized protein n=1 Tax=Collybia nuda TaxID=64659 RepID=A0A9P5XZ45_9AGAR|nr:hypothetical protein BDZ94DRAFT_1266509 [Collybia nuda]
MRRVVSQTYARRPLYTLITHIPRPTDHSISIPRNLFYIAFICIVVVAHFVSIGTENIIMVFH